MVKWNPRVTVPTFHSLFLAYIYICICVPLDDTTDEHVVSTHFLLIPRPSTYSLFSFDVDFILGFGNALKWLKSASFFIQQRTRQWRMQKQQKLKLGLVSRYPGHM